MATAAGSRQLPEPQEKDDCDDCLTDDAQLDIETSHAASQEYPQPIKEYGDQWDWDSACQDYVRFRDDGVKLFYTSYQRAAILPSSSEKPETAKDSTRHAAPSASSPEPTTAPAIARPVQPPVPKVAPHEEPLGEAFQVVAKPKRFFCFGRIFKTVWFEPAGSELPKKRPEIETWCEKCPPFRGEKPVAQFRWFIVVRRRLHHSLCFSITTYGGKAAAKTSRGRPMDYVVLYRANVEPPRPYADERIERDPIAIIIEDGDQYISPLARLDCGRIYTVQHDLKVMKVGRVHPAALPLLDQYYKESVA